MKNRVLTACVVVACTLMCLAWQPAMPATAVQPPPGKVTQPAWDATIGGGTVDIIVGLPGYPDLSPARLLPNREAKTRFVFETLTHYADAVQASLRAELNRRQVAYTVLWISNSLAIAAADRPLLQWLGARADVAQVGMDMQAPGVEPQPIARIDTAARSSSPQTVAWGVGQINAPQVWAQGYTGQGIVIADLDTGVQWDHPALQPQYRGWDGASATHAYNWYDPTGESSDTPTDDYGHGTHTTGTLIGDDGGSNQIGVAPGARWIACRNMLHGYGSVSRYTACFQFAMAPTDLNGQNANPALAADITSNSWTCWGQAPYNEAGCLAPDALLTVTEALRSAGIMVVAAAGNEGSGCSSVSHAPGMYSHVFTIGATDDGNNIAGFSSRGPSTFSGGLKPDVVGPGVGVYSSYPTDGYATESGTSMATPHVAGAVALIWSSVPSLRGDVDRTEALLRETASPLTATGEDCGGVPGMDTPNNTYGYGLVNVQAAESAALRLNVTATPAIDPSYIGDPLTYTLMLTNPQPLSAVNMVVTVNLASTAFVVGQMPPAVASSEHQITWTFASVGPHAMVTATLVVTASQAGLVTLSDYGVSYADSLSQPVQGLPVSTLIYAYRYRFVVVMRE